MASNSFGNLFRITTWGESHGKAIGVVIDGCPANIPLTEEEIQEELNRRRPGKSLYTSPRKESDAVEILSGLFEGKTTGSPISLLLYNEDVHSKPYEETKHLLRPGHANFTYLKKYGHFDPRGGGRASARETACRVAAGAVAKKLLSLHGIQIVSHLLAMGSIHAQCPPHKEHRDKSLLFCSDSEAEKRMISLLEEVMMAGDSIGGIVETVTSPLPVGLGDPVYEKLEARLGFAMMSLPASKGFEIGEGFKASCMRGSAHNDLFTPEGMHTNHSGGTLGGISSGMPLTFRVAFKPTSTIARPQETLTLEGKSAQLTLPSGSRHDPCVAIRAVAVVEAMTALVLADALLMRQVETFPLGREDSAVFSRGRALKIT